MRALLCCLYLLPFALLPGQGLPYYLPAGFTYDPRIPTPAAVLGYEVGRWHVSHDQQIRYFERLAAASPRLRLDTIGYTYERRPLVHLTCTSPAHQAHLDERQAAHLRLCDPQQPPLDHRARDTMPVVVWLGYSIHGNEASGGNAALVVAYHLAAAQGPGIDSLLQQAIILLDPCYNPDGFQRFATWVNSQRSLGHLDPLPESREHREPWPRGRTNHYWFDLNRDWLPAQHPESQARLAQFHAWKPNLLTDHHEMGRNSTFFFQPGVPSRNHPLIPDSVFALTRSLARYHATALDAVGSLYYSEEGFDDFYFGKGSTYPDLNGGIGILFEQASARGHLVDTDHGPLTFPFAIRNQVRTSLSSLAGAQALRPRLLAHQQRFFREASNMRRDTAAWLVHPGSDRGRLAAFLDLLSHHHITAQQLPQPQAVAGETWPAGSLVLFMDQPQGRLIEAMFEKRTHFRDSIFYDVSAWTLPLAFGLQATPIGPRDIAKLGRLPLASPPPPGVLAANPDRAPYAWAFAWTEYYAPRTLDRLLAAGVQAKVATAAFTTEKGHYFGPGSILIPTQGQALPAAEISHLLQTQAISDRVDVVALSTGLTGGANLGSNRFRPLQRPRVLLVTGEGVNAYEAGEVWHLLDYRFGMQVSLVDMQHMTDLPLHDFTALVMVGGSYGQLTLPGDRLRDWLVQGGTLVATKTALNWLKSEGLGRVDLIRYEPPLDQAPLPYGAKAQIEGAQAIGGAICSAHWDLTHPLAFGYTDPSLSLLHNARLVQEPASDPFATPLRYTEHPLQSGYMSTANQARLAGTAVVNVARVGRGHIISFTDNPIFRAFWYGTHKLFLNSLFFAPIID